MKSNVIYFDNLLAVSVLTLKPSQQLRPILNALHNTHTHTHTDRHTHILKGPVHSKQMRRHLLINVLPKLKYQPTSQKVALLVIQNKQHRWVQFNCLYHQYITKNCLTVTEILSTTFQKHLYHVSIC